MKKRAKRGDIGEHKFCPVCGRKLELNDTYCTKCGYSFASRGKKPKKLKWKNIIIFIILLIAAYFGVRYVSGQSVIPNSWQDVISTFLPKKI